MSVAEATTTPEVRLPNPTPRFRVGWIAGPGMDIPWFLGGALSGYFLLFVHAGLGWNMLIVWTVWYIILDAPHFFGTFVRTYLDSEERRRRPKLLWGSLGLFLVGPAILFLGYMMYQPNSPGGGLYHRLPMQVLIVFVLLWAHWHVIRQHYGIMALYQRKNNDKDLTDQRIDSILLYIGLLAPFVAFVFRNHNSRYELLSLFGSDPFKVPTWIDSVILTTKLAAVSAVALFLVRQVYRFVNRQPINLLKILFLAGVVSLHLTIGYHPSTAAIPLFYFAAFTTIYHDVQYHAIVWHYQRNRCHKPGTDPSRFGIAGWISRHFLIYATCAVLMGVIGYSAGCALGIEPGPWCQAALSIDKTHLYGSAEHYTPTLQTLAFMILLGFLMHHYFVDQFIWRPSKDKQLRHDLNMETASSNSGLVASAH